MTSLKLFIALISIFFISNKTKNLNLGFRVGKLRHSGHFDIVYGFVLQILIRNENDNFYFRV